MRLRNYVKGIVRGAVDSPVGTPGVLDDPGVFAFDVVPSDDLDGVVS